MTKKKHHDGSEESVFDQLSDKLTEAIKHRMARWIALGLIGLLLLGLSFQHLRAGLYWIGGQITTLPTEVVQQVQQQLYPEILLDDFVLSGIKNAHPKEVLQHLESLLAGQAPSEGVLTVMDLDLKALQSGLEKHPWVFSARISRLQTGQVAVYLQEEEARALYISPENHYWLVNESGEVFVRVSETQAHKFASLLILSGGDAEKFLPELLAARRKVPEAFDQMIRAERMRYSGWKLYYRRLGGAYYVYVHGKNVTELIPRLEKLVELEKRYQISARAVRGFDLRAWPKVRVDLLEQGDKK